VGKGSDALIYALFVDVDDQIQVVLLGHPVPELNHFLELPGGVHVEHGEGILPGQKALRARCSITEESLPME